MQYIALISIALLITIIFLIVMYLKYDKLKNIQWNLGEENEETEEIYLLIFSYRGRVHYREFNNYIEFFKFYLTYKNNISVMVSKKIYRFDNVQLN